MCVNLLCRCDDETVTDIQIEKTSEHIHMFRLKTGTEQFQFADVPRPKLHDDSNMISWASGGY